MSQNVKDKLVFLFSGLMIGLGAAAFFFNFKTIQMAKAQSIDPRSQVTENTEPSTDPFEDFFSEDPFEEMQQMQERLWKRFADDSFFPRNRSLFSRPNWNLGAGGQFRIDQRETSDFLIYEVVMDGAGEGSTMDVNVENQMVRVQGQKVSQSHKDQVNQQFFSSSSFSQSFSLPPGLDTENVVMENFGNKVILKFPKLKSEV